MSIHLKIVNFNKIFKQLIKPPIVINDIPTNTEEEKEELNKKIYTLYKSGIMNTIASCDCGELTGDYNLGVKCNLCNSEVTSPLYQDLEPILWVRAPKGIHKLINPHIWLLLNNTFTIANFSIIRWICESTYNPPKPFKDIQLLTEMGMVRGYNNFVKNFDKIIEMICSLKTYNKEPKAELVQLVLRVLRENRECIFCDYLPLPNKALLVIEDTSVGKYADDVYYPVVDAIQMIASIDTVRTRKRKEKESEPSMTTVTDMLTGQAEDDDGFINLTEQGITPDTTLLIDNVSIRNKENRVTKMLVSLSNFYSTYYKENLARKAGMVRKHIYSSRCNFSFRAVITSITEPHEYDELFIPWTVAVGSLRYHILNKLTKRGFAANDAVAFINDNARRYHPLLDEIFKELIDEAISEDRCTGELKRGIGVTLCRNP